MLQYISYGTTMLFQLGRPLPSLQALTVEREVSNDDDEFGGSDDEIGDDESQQTTGNYWIQLRSLQY